MARIGARLLLLAGLLFGLLGHVASETAGVGDPSFFKSHIAAQLSQDNFTVLLNELGDTKPCLIEFYASWCPACKHFAPTFEKLAEFLKDKDFKGKKLFIARVDCAAEVKLCGEFNINGYPSLFLGLATQFAMKKSKELTEFPSGPRDLPKMAKWVGEHYGTPLEYKEAEAAVVKAEAGGASQHTQSAGEGAAIAAAGGGGQAQAQAQAQAKRRPIQPPDEPEWTLADVEGATLTLWNIIATTPKLHRGAEKRGALKEVLAGWAAAHPSAKCKSNTRRIVGDFERLWAPDLEEAPAAFLALQPCGPPAGLAWRGQWGACKGSQPDSRGFSCGLWFLIHTMAFRLPDGAGAAAPAAAMMSWLLAFTRHFFMCEPCQKHFTALLTSAGARAVTDRRQLALWLWASHNEVNERLRGIETKYGHSTTGDPEWPKELWPVPERCPACRGPDGAWVEAEVWAYLQRAYGAGSAQGADGVQGSGRMLEMGLSRSGSVQSSSLIGGWAPVLCVLAAAGLLFAYLRRRQASRVDTHRHTGTAARCPFDFGR
ncbi:hypothetical protein HYH03_015258 [Edaphochlamys debaryana]|uniref:Sulfhydryl oxidase n=1 Tax=Edaphochlamys debaryana TaxID=47281 RepID=A0A835XPS2_9CHLO|nr:hypothetical protein HYH03_015258 [Edaphochlamys debaryana]|eukprot:KAG2486051.1 hypothetical protein HYH03_015258 [Edaphochlamys debaryana]